MYADHKNKNGFTVLELLIVIGIIGVLMIVGVVLLGTARERARDAKRIADLNVLKTHLEEYFFNNNKYPQAPAPIQLGTQGYKVLCAGTDSGFAETRSACGATTVYLEGITPPPDPQPAQAQGYVYVSAPPFTTYTITAGLEGAFNGLAGKVQVSPAGLRIAP